MALGFGRSCVAIRSRPVLAGLRAVRWRRRKIGLSTFRIRDGETIAYLLGYELISTVTLMAAAIGLGDSMRSRRALRAEQVQTARLIEREHDYRAEQRVQAERVRMARDLHDVLSHSITVIALYANVAREAIGDDDDQARQALSHIRSTSSATMRELHATLKLLCNPEVKSDLRADEHTTEEPISRAVGHITEEPVSRADGPVTVVLVDDQELVRTGLRILLERDPDIDVVGEAGNGRSGLRLVRRTTPNVALMDIRVPEMDGLEATRQIVADASLKRTKVVMLTTFDEDEQIEEAIRAGAAGYLLKDISPEDLRRAVHVVAGGEALLSPSITRRVMQQLPVTKSGRTNPELLDDLTERKREVLLHVGLGESNDEIAQNLYISPATARTYVSRLLAKLDVRDRSQLVILAYESGLVTPGKA